MIRRPRGLQLEIVASLFVVMLAGTLVLAVVLASLAVQAVQSAGFEQLELQAALIRRTMEREALRLEDLPELLRARGGSEGGAIFAFQRKGDARTARGSEALAVLVERAGPSGVALGGAGLPLRDLVLVRGVTTVHGERAALIGRVPRARIWSRLRPLLVSGAWVLGIAVLVFVSFSSYLLWHRIVRPVRALSEATLRVAAGELDARTGLQGSDELAELSRRFDEMAASLERERETVLRAFESLARSERLATVGQLAAGVAHEVGNPVAAILGYAEAAGRDPARSDRASECVSRIRAEALRVRALVRQLLDLARPEPLGLATHAPGEIMARAEALLRPQKVLAGIDFEVEETCDLPPITTDAGRVEQILINLVENAAHALRDTAAPRIRMRAHVSRVPFRRGRRRTDERVERAYGLVLEVTDNGPGIAEDILERIFDPFFTTKDPGEGTGLGLWNAHRLAEILGGRLEVRSGPGETQFSLVLPLTDSQE